MVVTSPRSRTKPSYDVPDNVVVLDDEDDVTVQKPPATGGGVSGGAAAVNQRRLYMWHQVAAHMRRERMLAEQIRAAGGVGPSGMMTSSPQHVTDNNCNIDPMIQFQAEVLQRQYLLYAHFYGANNNININNINRTGIKSVLGVNQASRVIRKPSSGGAAAGRLQYGYVHGGGAVARPENPFGMAPTRTRARVMNNSGPAGLGLGLGVGGGEIEPEGIDLTLKL